VCSNCKLHNKKISDIQTHLFALIGMALTEYKLGTQKYIDDTCD